MNIYLYPVRFAALLKPTLEHAPQLGVNQLKRGVCMYSVKSDFFMN